MRSLIKNKRAAVLRQVILHIILIGLIFGLFFLATIAKVNSRAVKQQVLEKQIALMIDSAPEGTMLSVYKRNLKGTINNVELKDGKIFIEVEGLKSIKGYLYFSRHDVSIKSDDEKFMIEIK